MLAVIIWCNSWCMGIRMHIFYILLRAPGWWFVSIGAEEGWAPCSYLERLNGKEEEEETISSLGKLYSSFWNTSGMWNFVTGNWSSIIISQSIWSPWVQWSMAQRIFFMWLSHVWPHVHLKPAGIRSNITFIEAHLKLSKTTHLCIQRAEIIPLSVQSW